MERTNVEISLDLRQNDIVAVTGRSGIGKSQVLRTLAGLEKVDRPFLKVAGESAKEMSMAEWRSRVALVPQERPTLEGTPNQFYKQARQYASQKRKEIAVASPSEYAEQWGLNAKAFDQPWSTLSGGESQRALLAIAIALQPEVLLLDESLSALDETTAKQVEFTLKELGVPIVMVSHSDAQVERFCNKRLSLDDATSSQSTLGVGT